MFLPATASELNPIEKMWAYFKMQWRRWLSDPSFQVNRHNLDEKLENCLNSVARWLCALRCCPAARRCAIC